MGHVQGHGKGIRDVFARLIVSHIQRDEKGSCRLKKRV